MQLHAHAQFKGWSSTLKQFSIIIIPKLDCALVYIAILVYFPSVCKFAEHLKPSWRVNLLSVNITFDLCMCVHMKTSCMATLWSMQQKRLGRLFFPGGSPFSPFLNGTKWNRISPFVILVAISTDIVRRYFTVVKFFYLKNENNLFPFVLTICNMIRKWH